MGAALPHPLGGLSPLAALPQWTVVLRPTKAPISAETGYPHDAHNPANWRPYETAARVAALAPDTFGIGFVLTTADPYFCVDVDGALQSDNKWSPLAQEICNALPGAVVERSQSGRGLHLWGRGPVPPHCKKNTALHIELYTEARYILIGSGATGEMAPTCPGIAAVAARYFPPPTSAGEMPADGPRADWRGPTDDDELLRRALQSRSAASVFGGGKAAYADLHFANATVLAIAYPPDSGSSEPYDRSSADAALVQHLAFWTGCDQRRMAKIADGSLLKREKWQREDYLQRTIANACRLQREVLRDRKPQPSTEKPEHFYILVATPKDTASKFLTCKFNGGTLRYWQGSFYQWGAGAWSGATPDDMRALMYAFIEAFGANDFKPNQTRVSNVIDALKATVHIESHISPPAWLDDAQGPPAADLVACANGMLHLQTGQLLAPTPRLFNLNALPLDFNPEAPTPQAWLRFLADVWPNDTEAIDTLQEICGYLLTPDTRQQKIFLVVGPKRSGKGTIARVLTGLLGAANVASPTLGSMAKDFGLQGLVGKLAAIVSDARLGGRADQKEVAENLLRISGEDQVEVNRKFLTPLALRLGVRFVLLTNELPKIADASGAMASRFVILKMDQSFLGREDPGLSARLACELPGILNWAVRGWHRLHARGHFVEPRSSAEAARELADLGSPIGAFVREECQTGPAASVKTDDIFTAWQTWSARQGNAHPGAKSEFGRDLLAAFPAITKSKPRTEGGERERVYRGVGLLVRIGPGANPFKA